MLSEEGKSTIRRPPYVVVYGASRMPDSLSFHTPKKELSVEAHSLSTMSAAACFMYSLVSVVSRSLEGRIL